MLFVLSLEKAYTRLYSKRPKKVGTVRIRFPERPKSENFEKNRQEAY